MSNNCLSTFLPNKYIAIKFLIFSIVLIITSNAIASGKLIFAIDLVRHGDRTPDNTIPNFPYLWGEGLGKLTALGKKQEYDLGVNFRKNYVYQNHLLPDQCSNDNIYVRSTDFDRTKTSAKYILSGLCPHQIHVFDDPLLIPIHTVPVKQDKLLAVKPSRNIFSLLKMYIVSKNAWQEKSILFKDDMDRWSKVTGMKINSFKKLARLADDLYIRQLHQMPLPQGISPQDAKKIISIAEWYIVTGFKYPEITYPTGHEFLSTVIQYMKESVNKSTKLKYVLFSGHDSSLMAVMNTLGVPVNKIPGYASDLNITLWQDNNNYYVKIKFNNKPVILPACGGEKCTLSQFEKAYD